MKLIIISHFITKGSHTLTSERTNMTKGLKWYYGTHHKKKKYKSPVFNIT